MMDKFPSLNEGAKILYTGTHKSRFLNCKILKKRGKNCFWKYQNFLHFTSCILLFLFGFYEIAFFGLVELVYTINRLFCPSND